MVQSNQQIQINYRGAQSLTAKARLQQRIDGLALDMLNQLDQIMAPRKIAPKSLHFSGYEIIGERYLVFWLDLQRLYHLSIDELMVKSVTDRMSTVVKKEVRADYSPEVGLTYSILLGAAAPKASVPQLPRLVKYDLNLTPERPLSIPFGQTLMGFQWLDLERMTHILVAGGSGSGKSNFVHGALVALTLNNTPDAVQIMLIDPKGTEFIHWHHCPHLLGAAATDGASAMALLEAVQAESDRRQKLFKDATARNYKQYQIRSQKSLPRLVVVVDEFVDLIAQIGPSFLSTLMQLATKSRSYGIHLFLTTASPKASVVDSTVRAQCDRVCFKVKEEGHSEAMFGKGHYEAFRLPNIPGRFLAVIGDSSELLLGQAVYLSDEQLDQVQAELRRRYTARTAVIDANPIDNDDDPEPLELTLNANERQWVAWALKHGRGRFNIRDISDHFQITNNGSSPVRALGRRLEQEGWLIAPDKPTESRLISEALRAEF